MYFGFALLIDAYLSTIEQTACRDREINRTSTLSCFLPGYSLDSSGNNDFFEGR